MFFLLQDAPQKAQSPDFTLIIVYMAAIFGIVYFLLIRPSRKKEKNRIEMLKNIKKNDRVITSGGIYGIVTAVGDNEITLKIDETNNVRVRFALNHIIGIVPKKGEEEA